MKVELSSSSNAMLNVLLWTLAVCNLTILSANVYRVFGPQKELHHTWLDRDNPLYVPTGPINTVEMTFQESTRFGFDPQNDWRTLYTSHHGIGFIHLGPFHHRFLGSTHHALHCVRRMIDDFNTPDHVSNPSHHFIHCLTYMRQDVLCNADRTLEFGDFMMRNFTTDRIGNTRSCRDWMKVEGWLNDNLRDWLDFNDLSLEKLNFTSKL